VRIDPIIDLDATAQVENYDITVGLHGTATNLKPTYRSEPPLSETDVFALLALGRTQEEAQLYQERQAQQGTDPTTSALLGGALNATVSNRVQKLFGVGSVKIDPAFVGTLGQSSASDHGATTDFEADHGDVCDEREHVGADYSGAV
jgi:translocation and assembly module TamB